MKIEGLTQNKGFYKKYHFYQIDTPGKHLMTEQVGLSFLELWTQAPYSFFS